ncbi:MFS transporter [Paraburkholderia sp. USG1]|uniref:MFS transporter n=1 Tax=Paraburkholderia sp. USG1 TaxID=2952268 RepID=UPI0028574447|nr:MFS transporter [Paraburkholderia sp. USG1]MDR8402161.1 MFS transporter [Paraburkholderia sp. USG1]
MEIPASPTLDIGRALDHGPFTLIQKIVVLMAAIAIVVDGFDGQLIGFAIPLMIREWGVSKAAFGPTLAAGLLGMGLGTVVAGVAADRVGRRRTLVACVLVFGMATAAIGFAPDILTVTALRFVAGLGIGGALPMASTTTAEFTPARNRTIAVAATVVCFPLGGMLAGLVAGWILPTQGWRTLFWFAGAVAVLLSVVLAAVLPESPRFLAHRRERWPQLVRLLARIQRVTPAHTRFTDLSETREATGQAGFGALFAGGQARNTLAIWATLFCAVLSLYSAFSWLPTTLTSEGLSVRIASEGLMAHNLGGVIGSLVGAWFVSRFGSRWTLAIACAGASISAFAMTGLHYQTQIMWLIIGFGIHGTFLNAMYSPMYALCAYVYPTEVRATGTSAALAVGRGGGVLSSFIGAAVIGTGGTSGFLCLLGGGMAAAGIALLFVRRHIPARSVDEPVIGLAIPPQPGPQH